MYPEIVKCPHCDSLIEYDERDLIFGSISFVGEVQIYVPCPECGNMITVGCQKI